MSVGHLPPFARKLMSIALFLALQLVWTASASATCGDHLQSHGTSMAEHLPSRMTTTPQHDTPRPAAPCRGLNCSKGAPVAPSPLPIKWHAHEHSCWLSVSDFGLNAADTASRAPADPLRPAEVRMSRLDRPPRAA